MRALATKVIEVVGRRGSRETQHRETPADTGKKKRAVVGHDNGCDVPPVSLVVSWLESGVFRSDLPLKNEASHSRRFERCGVD